MVSAITFQILKLRAHEFEPAKLHLYINTTSEAPSPKSSAVVILISKLHNNHTY